MANNTIDYNGLFEIWADFDDAKSNREVKGLIKEHGLGDYDAMSFMGFCYGYFMAIKYSGGRMSEISVYFITEAEDKEDARDNVESWIEGCMGREFFEGYEVSRTDVKRVFEVMPEYFENALRECEERAARYRKDIEEYSKKDDQFNQYMAGYAHVRLGNILMGSFCEDMPYWNLIADSWDLPEDENAWAVMVTLE